MKHLAAGVAGAILLASAAQAQPVTRAQTTAESAPVIQLSCYRGPTERVIWDRPDGTFVEDLVAYGYDYANAEAIARTICTDQSLVGKPDAMAEALKATMRKVPPAGRR